MHFCILLYCIAFFGCEQAVNKMPQVDWKTTVASNWLDSMQKEWNIGETAQLLMLASIDSAAQQAQLVRYFKGNPLDSFAIRQLNEMAITLVKNQALPLSTNMEDSLHLVFIGDIPTYFKTQKRKRSHEDRILEILQKSKLGDKDWEEIKKEREGEND